MASWRDRAHAVIDENYREIREAHEKFNRPITDAEILTIINRDNYPFGEREMLPYRAWCQAMREWKVKLGVPVKAQRRKAKCGCWFKGGEIETPCEHHQSNWQTALEVKC